MDTNQVTVSVEFSINEVKNYHYIGIINRNIPAIRYLACAPRHNNRHYENSLMIFIELHMRSSSEHAHILHGSKFDCNNVSPINVETTFFVLRFDILLLKLTHFLTQVFYFAALYVE